MALLLVFVPLFDFLFILITRGLDKRYRHWEDPIKMCGRDHLSHRLRYLGLSPRQVLVVLYGMAILSGLTAFAVARNPELLSLQSLLQGSAAILVISLGLKLVPLPKDAFADH